MDSTHANRSPGAGRAELVAQRLRAGSLVLAGIIALNGALDAAIRPGGLGPVAWIYGADLALVLLVQFATRDARFRPHALPFAATAVLLWNALFCSYAMLSPGEIHVLVAPSIVIVTAAALLLPWGLGLQALVSAASLVTYLGALVLAGRHTDLGALYALVSLLGAGTVSCVGAHLLARHAHLVARQNARLRETTLLMHEAGAKKDEFLASVSHELRTPLNVVLGYVDLLLDHSFGALEPAQRDALHRITKSASNLSHLINDLIDLSRIEAGRLKVDIGSVELEPLFGELATVMDVLLAGHDVAFRFDVAPGATGVRADVDRLRQIVSNLLVNAVKFTERGSITLRAAPHAPGQVAISVTDSGIGIPPAAQHAIFEPFRQVHDRSRRIPGAGIGLSISSRLAQLMGGSLTVESAPGRGSCFTLVVPAADGVGDTHTGGPEPLRRVS